MLWDDTLVSKAASEQTDIQTGRILTYVDALKEAITLKMQQDPSVIAYGQGVTDPGGMFGVTRDLHKQFGRERVFDTPVSEEGLTGITGGAAMTGLRPIYLHNRPDFLLLAFNQLVTHVSKFHYLDNGKTNVPMVVWSAIGRGWGSGAQHSQAIQGLLMGVPGLKIIMPSTAYDAKGLMISAIEDNNPVLIFEHRWLTKMKGHVPEGYYTVPIGKGIYRKRGKDLSIVGTSHTIYLAYEAAKQLAEEGIDAEVIDLRSLQPFDEEIIFESLAKTGKLLIVDTGWAKGGVCAEIACTVAEKAFHLLKAPIKRIGSPDAPSPAGYTLEQLYYPSINSIKQTIVEMVKS